MEGMRPQPQDPGMRVRLSGQLATLTTRKTPTGYTLEGRFRLDAPYQGLSSLSIKLPLDSHLLAGDSAWLEGTLLRAESDDWLFDCCS